MSFSNSILQINTKTWNKESHGLHDYDAAIYDSQSFEIHRTSALIKEGDKFSVVKASGNSQNRELIAAKGGMLALMVECPDGIKVCPSNLDNENQLWFSLDERNQTSRKGHLLKENDVVKIGRTTIIVRQIKSEETSIADIYRSPIFQSIKKEHSTGSVNSIQISSSTDAGSPRNEGSCRLCHSDSQSEENPLISPCNCSDSRKYAHYKCIQEWMRKRSCVLSNQKIIDFNWEKLSCEHCKTGIPLTMTHQGKELMLVPLNDRLSKSYAILEFFSRDNNSTGIFVVGLDVLGKYKIGRGHECDFQIDDNSVSRVHANLTISRGKLYVIDNTSRFGTLVLAKEPFILNNLMKNCWVQCGKTLIEFDLQKPWISFLPCFDSVCNNNCLKNSKAHVKKALKEDPRIEAKLASESDDSKKSPITLL